MTNNIPIRPHTDIQMIIFFAITLNQYNQQVKSLKPILQKNRGNSNRVTPKNLKTMGKSLTLSMQNLMVFDTLFCFISKNFTQRLCSFINNLLNHPLCLFYRP